ncbi:HES4A-like protein [Mya arenaria]|uniref:HES4A-like protein n=1 Tax=Mya arenaria TaxID=6604 RepID=A0ABY7F156_MYAAR|nr:transcription factor HES-1-A-like [Mya arenaria]WAR14479.1 HES4A-like protein [Mya arenaria]
MADTAVEKRIMSPHNANMDKKDSAYKRSNKPFMEKKRRARINNCLTQLKSLVLQAMRKDTNQYSKLEKADILEMTVKHLRHLQRQHVSQAMTTDPNTVTKYKSGFNECANEVVRYLGSVEGVDSQVRTRLVSHLGNVVTRVNSQTPDHQPQQLNVQIPQMNQHQNGQNLPNGCLLMPASVHTSPLVLQPVQNVTNVSNVYAQGHNTAQQQTTHPNSQFYNSFQISTSPVAVYLGQSQVQTSQPQTITSSPVMCSAQTTVPVYTPRSPPRTKASLKAYDSSAFSQLSSGSEHSNNSSPSCSPVSRDTSFSSQFEYAVNCGRTPSPLKVEDVWRPW